MKMVSTLAAVSALTLILPLPNPAWADPRQDPTAEYMADLVMTIDGNVTATSKIWRTKNKTRTDVIGLQGQPMSLIYDWPAKKKIGLLPETKLYFETPLTEADFRDPYRDGSSEIARVGEEAVAGVQTTKWSVRDKGKGTHRGFVWTTNENIQVKTEMELTSKTTFELKNLKIGPVDPKVFEIPIGYQPVPKDEKKN